jgi:hypothetical protein
VFYITDQKILASSVMGIHDSILSKLGVCANAGAIQLTTLPDCWHKVTKEKSLSPRATLFHITPALKKQSKLTK